MALVAICCLMGGCATNDEGVFTTESLSQSPRREVDKLVDEGRVQFTERHYGLAIDKFAKAVELDAGNHAAWLGLAASYDQVNRFDEADRAYTKVQQLVGPTPSVLNNLGYSYLLRGNLNQSRATLEAAYRSDPGNPYILNNINILNERLATLGQTQLNVH